MKVVGALLLCWLTLVIESRGANLDFQKPEAQASEAEASKGLTVVRQPEPDAARSQGAVFYVNKYGAKADGNSDDSKV